MEILQRIKGSIAERILGPVGLVRRRESPLERKVAEGMTYRTVGSILWCFKYWPGAGGDMMSDEATEDLRKLGL